MDQPHGSSGLTSIFFVDQSRGWVAGGRNILKTITGGVVNVRDEPHFSPQDFFLQQNYPNPFNSETRIRYELRQSARATLKVYDVLGQEINVLTDEIKPAGSNLEIWDGTNKHGTPLSTGVYFIMLKALDRVQLKKMILLR